MRRRSWKGYLLVADVEELQENDASEVYFKNIKKTREVLLLKVGYNLILPCADGPVKLAVKGCEVRPSNRIGQDIEEGDPHRSDLQGETDEPDSAEQQRKQYELEAKPDFWSISGNFIYRHQVQGGQKFVRATRMLVNNPTDKHHSGRIAGISD